MRTMKPHRPRARLHTSPELFVLRAFTGIMGKGVTERMNVKVKKRVKKRVWQVIVMRVVSDVT
jgi:hypothetical protein